MKATSSDPAFPRASCTITGETSCDRRAGRGSAFYRTFTRCPNGVPRSRNMRKTWGRPPVRGRKRTPRVARIAPGPPTRRAERDSNDLLALAASRAALGDTSAVRFLHARMADEVHACVRAIVRRPATARAVAEKVFTELPGRIASYRPRELPFDVWLLGIATEAAIERVGHETPTNGSTPAGEPEHDAPRRQAARDAVLGASARRALRPRPSAPGGSLRRAGRRSAQEERRCGTPAGRARGCRAARRPPQVG